MFIWRVYGHIIILFVYYRGGGDKIANYVSQATITIAFFPRFVASNFADQV